MDCQHQQTGVYWLCLLRSISSVIFVRLLVTEQKLLSKGGLIVSAGPSQAGWTLQSLLTSHQILHICLPDRGVLIFSSKSQLEDVCVCDVCNVYRSMRSSLSCRPCGSVTSSSPEDTPI